MASPLDGCGVRIGRAVEHFDELRRQHAALAEESKAITFRQKFHPDTNKVVIEIATVPVYPQRWALYISEALFNLRAALDYLAWELAVWNLKENGETREPYRWTQYPIATTPDRFQPRHAKDLHVADRTFIERLQPYGPIFMAQFDTVIQHFPDIEPLTRKHPPAGLARLNDHDKHRTLHPVAFGSVLRQIGEAEGHDCDIVHRNFFITDFRVGAQSSEFQVVPTGPNPEVDVNDRVHPGIGVNDMDFLTGFPRIVQFVSGLVRDFTPVFAEGRHPVI